MLVYNMSTKINSLIKEIDYPYTLRNKHFYYSAFPWDGCCIVEYRDKDGKDSIEFFTESQEVMSSITEETEKILLEKMKKKSETDKDFDYKHTTFLVYLPKNMILADLTNKKEYINFNFDFPLVGLRDKSAYLAVYFDGTDWFYCRVKNDPKVMSMVFFRGEADNLISPTNLNRFGCDVVYSLANIIHGGIKKEYHIRTEEHPQPIHKKVNELPLKKATEIFWQSKEKETDKIILPASPNNKFSLAQIIEKGLIPKVEDGQVNIDTELSNKDISSAKIEKGRLVFLMKRFEVVTTETKDKLEEELGISPIVVRFRQTGVL